jgi:DNA-directed RNA polymerase specialized sigma24 family protein
MAWQELANELTADLIEYIRWRNQPEYKDLAEDAFRAFCFRFSPELQKTCRIICANRGYDSTVADEIAEKTFARFLKYPKYDHSKCKCGEIDKCVLLYLFKFARRLLSDYAISEKRGPNPFTGDEEIVTEFWDIEAMDIPQERKAQLLKKYEIIKAALERLSPKHKIIYLTYKEYEQELSSGYNFPPAFRKRMQEYLEISQVSIRVYKKEAFDKVDEYLKIYGAK